MGLCLSTQTACSDRRSMHPDLDNKRNDVLHAIKVYQSVFGERAMHLIPLRLLTYEGVGAYLGRLGQIIGSGISQTDVDRYLPRNVSPKHDMVLTPEQADFIRQSSAAGHAFLAEHFGLPLAECGYPMP
jgi:hypothetical protein